MRCYVSEEWEQNHPISFEEDKIHITVFFPPSFLPFHTKSFFYDAMIELKFSETKKNIPKMANKKYSEHVQLCAYTYSCI